MKNFAIFLASIFFGIDSYAATTLTLNCSVTMSNKFGQNPVNFAIKINNGKITKINYLTLQNVPVKESEEIFEATDRVQTKTVDGQTWVIFESLIINRYTGEFSGYMEDTRGEVEMKIISTLVGSCKEQKYKKF